TTSLAMVIHEIAFGSVAVQVRLRNVEIAAKNRSLEDREIIFDRIGVPEISANIFLDRVIDPAMSRELGSNAGIDGATVRHQVSRFINIGGYDWPQTFGGHVSDVEDLTLPERSTSDSTTAFGGTFPLRFSALPPTKVSSISTTLLAPPNGPGISMPRS